MYLIQTLSDDEYYFTLHFDTSLIDVYFESRSQECEKAKTSVPIISQSFELILNGIWYTIETCWCE